MLSADTGATMGSLRRHPVLVYSGVEAVKRYGEGLCEELLLPVPVSLVLDDPWGFALTHLAEIARPVLIVTASKSLYYLHDLVDLKPEGLEIPTSALTSLTRQLESVAAGEHFYSGPPLGESLLSPREREVFRMVTLGATNDEIAQTLEVSPRTAANYISSVKDKLGLKNIAELVLFYFGLLDCLHGRRYEPPLPL